MADYRIAVGPQQGHKAFTLQIMSGYSQKAEYQQP
jgi:hypothetical protein